MGRSPHFSNHRTSPPTTAGSAGACADPCSRLPLPRNQPEGAADPSSPLLPSRDDPTKPSSVPNLCVDPTMLAELARQARKARNEKEEEAKLTG
eukprot:CAMPEP_0169447272 /NCGR_PEP_ID=MMETSP1042-20121227/11431_1 /TAXON_ID=464988 /ORGANISM="Hemiselmis andersenii, Strain CCMP1180" /LENGTH=93 /DNA_ID=CAMNT_0009558817 /DNA_START=265 /DNA_END=542 /DNA_ORIENTATION=+